MNSNQKCASNLLRIKELLQCQTAKKQKQSQNTISTLKSYKKKDLFEAIPTVLTDYDLDTGPKVDLIYYRLNTDFLSKNGLKLNSVYSKEFVSKSGRALQYVEYYVDSKKSCLIFVKHHFKHVHLYSSDGKTNLFTYVFVNFKNEIYYYDDFTDLNFVKQATFKPEVLFVNNFLKSKVFKVQPSEERTFKLFSPENPDEFEEKSLSNIHLLPKELLDILLRQYKNNEAPSKSKIQIETKFLGLSQDAITAQLKVEIYYRYSGKIEVCEKIEEHEITLYFIDFPDKKVRARFYLTQAEKNQKLTLTDDLLKNAVLEVVNESLERVSDLHKNLYKIHCVKQESNSKKDNKIAKDCIKVIFDNIAIKKTFCECPMLKNTFGKIYIDRFSVNADVIKTFFPFDILRENHLEYCGSYLKQSSIYSVVYNNAVYLLEIYADYSQYIYTSPSITLYIPAFGISEVEIKLFKPTCLADIDKFVNNSSSDEFSKKVVKDYNSHGFDNVSRDEPFSRKNWKNIFNDFTLELGNNQDGTYTFSSICSDTIYQKVIDCINTSRNETSLFNFSVYYPFGAGDDDEPKTRIPFVSEEITYGYYFDNGYNDKTINCPMKEKCDYSYSGKDELLRISFDDKGPSYKATLYSLLEKCTDYFYRDVEMKVVKYSIDKRDLWNKCAQFLLSKQDEIFSE